MVKLNIFFAIYKIYVQMKVVVVSPNSKKTAKVFIKSNRLNPFIAE